MTDLIAPENKLAGQNKFLEDIITSLPVSIAVITPRLELLKANAHFFKFFDLTVLPAKNEYLANLKNFFWQDSEVIFYLTECFGNKQFNFEREFISGADKNSLIYTLIKVNILKNITSDEPYIMLTFFDLTAARQKETANQEHIRFMMHEIRNPLSNISLCLELLSDSIKENNNEDIDLFLSKAGNNVQRLKQLINDLSAANKNPVS